MDKCPRCKSDLVFRATDEGVRTYCPGGCFTGFEATECFNTNKVFKVMQMQYLRGENK